MTISANGRPAITELETLETTEKYSFLKLNLKTGRTHQIRAHLKAIHHPVVGDKIYGIRATDTLRLMLHSYKVIFTHPFTKKKVEIIAPLKKDFKDILVNYGFSDALIF